MYRHKFFYDNNDIPQVQYEKVLKAILDHRCNRPSHDYKRLQKHGVAGLLINPEDSLSSISLQQPPRVTPRQGTALYQARLCEDTFESIALSLAEGVGVSATSRIQKTDKKTVLRTLTKAGTHAQKVSRSFLLNIKVTECQLDEMWSFVGKKEKNLSTFEKLQQVLGDAWIWIAFDAVNKIVPAYVVGKRTLPNAVALLENVKKRTAGIPELFSSDQLDHSANALLQVYGETVQPRRKPGPGRPPGPILVPPKNLNYVHVVKQYKQNRVFKVTHKVVFGDPEKIKDILNKSVVSRKINTSYVERYNGTVRHIDARCSRKTYRFSKIKRNHEYQLALSIAYYHLCKPQRTLTKRCRKPTTPFMAAGLTDHIWSMKELLEYKP